MIQPALKMFNNKDRQYLIRGVANKSLGSSYRTGLEGRVDFKVMLQWIEKTHAILTLACDRKTLLLSTIFQS